MELLRTTDREVLAALGCSGDVYIFFFDADEVVSCFAILSKNELDVPPPFFFLGVGDLEADTGSILPFIVAEAKVSVFDMRSKKLFDVLFLPGEYFGVCLADSILPFIVADA